MNATLAKLYKAGITKTIDNSHVHKLTAKLVSQSACTLPYLHPDELVERM